MFADEVARRYVEAIDKKDPSGFAALFADGAMLHDPFFPEPTKGRDAIRAMIAGILRAFPDMTWEQVGDPIEAGGRAALVMAVHGTNDGPLSMPAGECRPPGRRSRLRPRCCGRSARMGSSRRSAATSTRRVSQHSSA